MKVSFWRNSKDKRKWLSWTSEWLSRPNDDGDFEKLLESSDVGTSKWLNDKICEWLSKWNGKAIHLSYHQD